MLRPLAALLILLMAPAAFAIPQVVGVADRDIDEAWQNVVRLYYSGELDNVVREMKREGLDIYEPALNRFLSNLHPYDQARSYAQGQSTQASLALAAQTAAQTAYFDMQEGGKAADAAFEQLESYRQLMADVHTSNLPKKLSKVDGEEGYYYELKVADPRDNTRHAYIGPKVETEGRQHLRDILAHLEEKVRDRLTAIGYPTDAPLIRDRFYEHFRPIVADLLEKGKAATAKADAARASAEAANARVRQIRQQMTSDLHAFLSGGLILGPIATASGGRYDAYDDYVTGTVTNGTSSRVTIVIEFQAYNSRGEIMDTLLDIQDDVGPGQVWRYTVGVPKYTARVELSDLYAR